MAHLTRHLASCAALTVKLALLSVAASASASVVTTGCAGPSPVFGVSCTLEELGRGGSFQVDGLLFTNFSYMPDARGPHEIVFVPMPSPTGPSFMIRRDGRVLMDAQPNGQEFLDLRFDVIALGGGSISNMGMTGIWGYQHSTANEDGAHVEVRVEGAPAQDPALSAQRLFCGSCDVSSFDAGVYDFDPTLSELTLDLHAHVFSGVSDPDATAQIGLLTLAFGGVGIPVPGTLALLLGGLATASAFRRRTASKPADHTTT